MNKRCPDCDSVRVPKDGGLWCPWCKHNERELNVRDMLQNEWERRD